MDIFEFLRGICPHNSLPGEPRESRQLSLCSLKNFYIMHFWFLYRRCKFYQNWRYFNVQGGILPPFIPWYNRKKLKLCNTALLSVLKIWFKFHQDWIYLNFKGALPPITPLWGNLETRDHFHSLSWKILHKITVLVCT